MPIDARPSLHACRRGHATIEFVFIVPLLLVVFFLGYNATLAIRDRTDLIGALRTAVWAGWSADSTVACTRLARGGVAEGQRISCKAPAQTAMEESVAGTPFWDDALDAARGRLVPNRMGEDMIRAVTPGPVLLRRGESRQGGSVHAARIGASGAARGADGFVLPDPMLWTHHDDPLSQGYDRIIKSRLDKRKIGDLFPNVYTKAD